MSTPDRMMTPERWQRVKDVVARALEIESARRAAFLDQACSGEVSLREEVERLLLAEERAGSRFLSDAAVGFVQVPRLPASGDRRIGQILGAYKIISVLGQGGMGMVYRAARADDQFQKQVAIKLVQGGRNSAFVISRFKNERQILANLDHPNIARLLDGGTTEDGIPYFAMELIEGEPIDVYSRVHRLTIEDRIKLFLDVCSAVQYAHRRLIVHRDLKPSNILVTSEGVAKLLDFGIAKILDSDGAQPLEQTTMSLQILTPAYASPEQVRGAHITTASDVYSLGVVLYELLTGLQPYSGGSHSMEAMARAICEEEPQRPSTAVRRAAAEGKNRKPGSGAGNGNSSNAEPVGVIANLGPSPQKISKWLSGDLDNIVLMALRKEPDRRYASVEQFADDLHHHLQSMPVIAAKDTLFYRAGKFISRYKVGVIAALSIVIVLLGALFITLREARIARRERARAEQRFNDVRKLANSLIFEVHDSVQDLPGSTPVRKLILDRAIQYLDSLAKDSAGDTNLQRELAVAYHRIGQVQGDTNQGNLGQTQAMVVSMRKAAALFDEVATANPNVVMDQLNSAFGHRLLAGVTDDRAEQRRQIQAALAITGHLVTIDKSNPKVVNERSIEMAVFAAQQDADGDVAGAIASLRQALDLKQAVTLLKPDYPHIRQSIAMTNVQLADELAAADERKSALELNANGIAGYQSVVEQEKNNTRALRELAVSISKRGEIQMMEGDYSAALASYQRTLAIMEQLQKKDPENVLFRSDVAAGNVFVGKALVSLGQVNRGLALIDRGIPLLESQFAKDPNSMSVAAASYVWRSEALAMTANWSDAIANCRKAISILESPASRASDPTEKSQLAAIYVKLGNAFAHTGIFSEADAAYGKALTIIEPLRKTSAPNLRVSYVLADAYFGLGEDARKDAGHAGTTAANSRQQLTAARDWYSKSQAVWREIPNPGTVNLQGFLCGNPKIVADSLRSQSTPGSSRVSYVPTTVNTTVVRL